MHAQLWFATLTAATFIGSAAVDHRARAPIVPPSRVALTAMDAPCTHECAVTFDESGAFSGFACINGSAGYDCEPGPASCEITTEGCTQGPGGGGSDFAAADPGFGEGWRRVVGQEGGYYLAQIGCSPAPIRIVPANIVTRTEPAPAESGEY